MPQRHYTGASCCAPAATLTMYDADPVGVHRGQPDNTKPQVAYGRRPGGRTKSSTGGWQAEQDRIGGGGFPSKLYV